MKSVWLKLVPGLSGLLYLSTVQAGPLNGVVNGSDLLPQISLAARQADVGCNHLMHDNADEFGNCLDAMGAAIKGKTAQAQAKRLGIAYFGWVGATRWGRISLPGSDEAAVRYYLRYLPLQQQLKITDLDLCSSIVGDCKERLAQLAEIKKVVAAKKPPKKP